LGNQFTERYETGGRQRVRSKEGQNLMERARCWIRRKKKKDL
jgi:hypothetical protein